jgi:hypothetical protein
MVAATSDDHAAIVVAGPSTDGWSSRCTRIRSLPSVAVMSPASLPLLAGIASTVIFAGSTLPMLGKAVRTRDLGSYSLGNLMLANTGNAVHSIYVFSLPPGPLWILHSFYLVSTGLMLAWFLRYELLPMRGRAEMRISPDAERAS